MRRLFTVALSLALTSVTGCSTLPSHIQNATNSILPCGSTPNCISSKDPRAEFQTAPVHSFMTLSDLHKALASLPRCKIMTETATYLHLECRSQIFQFVDDLELLMENGALHLRSASRVGYSDLGVNQKRIDTFKAALTASQSKE